MEPVSFLLGLLVLTGCFSVGVRVTSDALATARAAKAGQWDLIDRDRQRRASRGERWAAAWDAVRARRHRQAGGTGEYRPGFGAYAADVYHGFWEDQLAKRQANRAARPGYEPDPNRRRWHERIDEAVIVKVNRLREAWRRRQPGYVPQHQVSRTSAKPVESSAAPVEPVAHDPGTWTVGDDGERVPLAPTGDPQPTESGPAAQPAAEPVQQDPIDETNREEPMGETAATSAAATATEVQTNEDARRNFQAMADAAAEAADALAALEVARAKMIAASQATADGMSAKAFDAGATAAANDAADAIGLDTLGGWAEKIDAVRGAADKGLAGLDKYRDAEAQVAEERIDPTTLAATSS
jgi:hypothetical protein